MIMFTGSTCTGRKVAARAAERRDPPCPLELGGKDPMIVCADADLDRAANAAATWGLCEQRPGLHVGRAHLRRAEGRMTSSFTSSSSGSKSCASAASPPRGGRRRRDDLPAAAGGRGAPCRGRSRQGRASAHRRPACGWPRPVLRAHGPRRCRSRDGLHARGDLRPDAARHEGPRCRRGGAASQ